MGFKKAEFLHNFFNDQTYSTKIIVEKQTYSYDEAYEATLKYFNGDELAARVWVNKYAVKDSFGHIYEKTPTDMHWRIANEVARIEAKYPNALSPQELFDLIVRDFFQPDEFIIQALSLEFVETGQDIGRAFEGLPAGSVEDQRLAAPKDEGIDALRVKSVDGRKKRREAERAMGWAIGHHIGIQ